MDIYRIIRYGFYSRRNKYVVGTIGGRIGQTGSKNNESIIEKYETLDKNYMRWLEILKVEMPVSKDEKVGEIIWRLIYGMVFGNLRLTGKQL